MGAFYGKKILSGEINPGTGKAWALEDVPPYWKKKTAEWMEGGVN